MPQVPRNRADRLSRNQPPSANLVRITPRFTAFAAAHACLPNITAGQVCDGRHGQLARNCVSCSKVTPRRSRYCEGTRLRSRRITRRTGGSTYLPRVVGVLMQPKIKKHLPADRDTQERAWAETVRSSGGTCWESSTTSSIARRSIDDVRASGSGQGHRAGNSVPAPELSADGARRPFRLLVAQRTPERHLRIPLITTPS